MEFVVERERFSGRGGWEFGEVTLGDEVVEGFGDALMFGAVFAQGLRQAGDGFSGFVLGGGWVGGRGHARARL